jgi:hypothetical protein
MNAREKIAKLTCPTQNYFMYYKEGIRGTRKKSGFLALPLITCWESCVFVIISIHQRIYHFMARAKGGGTALPPPAMGQLLKKLKENNLHKLVQGHRSIMVRPPG